MGDTAQPRHRADTSKPGKPPSPLGTSDQRRTQHTISGKMILRLLLLFVATASASPVLKRFAVDDPDQWIKTEIVPHEGSAEGSGDSHPQPRLDIEAGSGTVMEDAEVMVRVVDEDFEEGSGADEVAIKVFTKEVEESSGSFGLPRSALEIDEGSVIEVIQTVKDEDGTIVEVVEAVEDADGMWLKSLKHLKMLM